METLPVAMNIVNFEEYAMSADKLVAQMDIIKNIMRRVMVDGEHYGTIPGCGNKRVLLKPGTEKINTTFRLAPHYQITKSELKNGHREYEVTTTLKHIPTGSVVGQGVGSCSTMESKYRYRTGEVKPTGKPVPKAYWENRDQKLLGGPGHSAKKIDGQWQIVEAGEKVEHDNPADYYNTVLKMAKKRSHTDAILSATAASDIFIQDKDEDLFEEHETSTENYEPQEQQQPTGQAWSDPQRKKLYAMLKAKGMSTEDMKRFNEYYLRAINEPEFTKDNAKRLFDNFDSYFNEFTKD